MTEHKLKAIVLLEEAQHMMARDLSRVAANLQWKIDQLRNGPVGRNGREETNEPVREVDASDFFELDQLRDHED